MMNLEKHIDEQKDILNSMDLSEFSDTVLPKEGAQRDMGVREFATLWMGSVHNVLAYMTVAGFFLLGLNSKQVIWAVMTSAIIVSFFYVINGVSSAKYGVPFTILLRSIFGTKGALIPSVARAFIAAIVFFGTQTVIRAQAFDVIFERLFPGFMSIGNGATIFGLPVYTALSYALVWAITIALLAGGNDALKKLGTVASPIIYISMIGAAIWAINLAGGFSNVINFEPENAQFSAAIFIACVSSLVSNWAGPMVNIGDFTQRAKDKRSMVVGLPLGFILSYVLFALTCVGLIAGTQIAFQEPIFNIIQAFNKIESTIAVIIILTALNLGATALVVFGNLFPGGLLLTNLFPKKFNVIKGAFLVSLIGTVILPWKLVETQTMLFYFYSFIGSMFGPLIGIMISDYFFNKKQFLDYRAMYGQPNKDTQYAKEYNPVALTVLGIGFTFSFIGAIFRNVSVLVLINQFAFFSGFALAFVLYTIIVLVKRNEA